MFICRISILGFIRFMFVYDFSDLDSYISINEIFIISFGAAPEFETGCFSPKIHQGQIFNSSFCYVIECCNFNFSPRILFFYMQGLGELNREGLKKMPLCVDLVSEKEQGEDGAFFFQWKME